MTLKFDRRHLWMFTYTDVTFILQLNTFRSASVQQSFGQACFDGDPCINSRASLVAHDDS